MFLHNKLSRKELREKLQAETFRRITLSLYRYVIIENPAELRDKLFQQWSGLEVLGRIYVAREGINAQLSVPEHHIEAFKKTLQDSDYFRNIRLNVAVEDDGKSFYKLIIKVRSKLVADGLRDDTFDVTNVGTHLSPAEFNAALEDPSAIAVDMRNFYESEVGHFENAVCPDAATFKEELPMVSELLQDKKDKKLLLYCTGGIRCEKASAYLRHKGFKNVCQLHGGIISYAQEVKAGNIPSRFIGKNFVFDERMGERITNDIISKCHQCGTACDRHVNCANDDCHLLFIQCEKCAGKNKDCCSTACTRIVMLPPEQQKQLRKGRKKTETHAVFRSRRRVHFE